MAGAATSGCHADPERACVLGAGGRCEVCGKRAVCGQCGEAVATVYAIDRAPGGWGGRYCEPCADALGFVVVDRLAG